jgi:two-component system NtrC family sensor kinase
VTASNLRALGHEIMTARNRLAGLEQLARGGQIDLGFSDLVMSGMTGLEYSREVQKRYPEIPILLVTGYSDAAQKARLDGLSVLSKPYRMEALISPAK